MIPIETFTRRLNFLLVPAQALTLLFAANNVTAPVSRCRLK